MPPVSRLTLAFDVVVTAGGMALLAHVGETGSYVRAVLPGMLVPERASASPSSPSRSRSARALARRRQE